MGGKRMAGHDRTTTPLSPIPGPRRSPADGWRVDCTCGWNALPFGKKADAEAAYSVHLSAAYPTCSKCGNAVPKSRLSRFRSSLCKRCSYQSARAWKAQNPKAWDRSARKSHLKTKYGITPAQFDEMLRNQNGRCAICMDEVAGDSRGFRPHIDHCHSTGRVRGILCSRCNKGIGSLRDDAEIVQRALSYLMEHKE